MKTIHLLKRMDYLIESRATGKPEEFARQLSLSQRSLFNYIALLKELGGPIRYNRFLESYFYLEDGKFVFEFKKEADLAYAV